MLLCIVYCQLLFCCLLLRFESRTLIRPEIGQRETICTCSYRCCSRIVDVVPLIRHSSLFPNTEFLLLAIPVCQLLSKLYILSVWMWGFVTQYCPWKLDGCLSWATDWLKLSKISQNFGLQQGFHFPSCSSTAGNSDTLDCNRIGLSSIIHCKFNYAARVVMYAPSLPKVLILHCWIWRTCGEMECTLYRACHQWIHPNWVFLP